ncbi:hypothetical protein, partial [Mycetohabitans sp. B6]|uniref:hypothetical protein n=1 Tax=Mycetohabitans sp. B6 TaxID=2841843 RepID=UPI001F29F38B
SRQTMSLFTQRKLSKRKVNIGRASLQAAPRRDVGKDQNCDRGHVALPEHAYQNPITRVVAAAILSLAGTLFALCRAGHT